MDQPLFDYVELCLTEYHENLAILRERRAERERLPLFSDPSGERVQGGETPDPVGIQFLKLEKLDRDISVLEGRTAPITHGLAVIGQRPQYAPILSRYFEGRGWKEIGAQLKCSRSKVYKLRLNLVRIFGKLMVNSWRAERGPR